MRHAACLLAATAASLALAGCDVERDPATKGGKDVHISLAKQDGGNHVAIDVPGFDGKISLPGFNIGGHMDIDGMKLAPDTDVTTMDITGGADGEGHGPDGDGNVRIAFTNPAPPATVIAYYRKAAADAGYTVAPTGGDGALSASKADKKFALALSPEGSGSRGRIDITGS